LVSDSESDECSAQSEEGEQEQQQQEKKIQVQQIKSCITRQTTNGNQWQKCVRLGPLEGRQS
jgi:hypothetical protein